MSLADGKGVSLRIHSIRRVCVCGLYIPHPLILPHTSLQRDRERESENCECESRRSSATHTASGIQTARRKQYCGATLTLLQPPPIPHILRGTHTTIFTNEHARATGLVVRAFRLGNMRDAYSPRAECANIY